MKNGTAAAARAVAVQSGDSEGAYQIPVVQASSFANSDLIDVIVYTFGQVSHLWYNMGPGISVIENGSITDSFFSYVNPETHFDCFNTQLTGIDENTVADSPTFPELWETIEPLLSSGILVAHNAVFDMSVLKKCLIDYNIAWKPSAKYCCTVQMGRRLLPGIKHGLGDMCDYYGICLDHHKADSDSRACAEILLRYLKDGAEGFPV